MNYKTDVENAVKVLKKGGVILYPTDTIWGLGCDARNIQAVTKIYEIKKRVFSKSMIILVKNISDLKKITNSVPLNATDLIKKTKKPLTIIYQNAENLAKNVVAEDGTVAIRIPNDEFCQTLLKELGAPIVSTSANISGESSPYNFNEISDEIKKQSDYIVKWRQNDFSKTMPSTILKIEPNGKITVIRS